MESNIPKVLFVTRKYPPKEGGMENLLYSVTTNYPGPKKIIAYGGSQKFLPFVYVWLFLRAAWAIISSWRNDSYDLVMMGDGVMTPMGFALKRIFRLPVLYIAMGKDINFDNALYDKLVRPFLSKLDGYVAISQMTRDICHEYGLGSIMHTIITPGVDTKDFRTDVNHQDARVQLAEKYDIDLRDRHIILSLGRLSRRKGVPWFIENVMSKLPERFVYFVVGADSTDIDGVSSMVGLKKVSLRNEIDELIASQKLEERVYMLGKVPFEDVKLAYKAASVFVMPNITVPGDREGFGIVNIEAGASGTPVVASGIEGILDAVIDGVTGSLVESQDTDAFVNEIEVWDKKIKTQEDRSKITTAVEAKFNWESIMDEYVKFFNKFVK